MGPSLNCMARMLWIAQTPAGAIASWKTVYNRMRSAQWIALTTLVLCGCQHTATVTAWTPADIDVSGLSRLAVLDFQGEQGAAVASSIGSQLWKNDFYTVVDRSELQPVMQASFNGHGAQVDEILAPARAAGLDAVILGEVVEYRCEDETFQSTDLELGMSESKGRGMHREGTGLGLSIQETLLRQGTVSMSFRLVDVHTGEIRAAKQVSHHFEGRIVNGDGHLPPRGEVLQTLSNQCVDEIVTMLAPHECECVCELATSEWHMKARREVSQGVKLAQKGQWAEAEKHWQMALQINPKNDAAMYNLALSAVNRQEFVEAEGFAMQALRLRHRDKYVKGLEKIRDHRAAYEKTEQQRDARIVPASATVFR